MTEALPARFRTVNGTPRRATLDVRAEPYLLAPPTNRHLAVGPTMFWGLALVAIFFGGLGTWASLAPLAGAVVAHGTVKVLGDRKEVEHLEGGILKKAHVVEGATVEAEQVLFELDTTKLEASRKIFANRLTSALAQEARLTAEKIGAMAIAFPASFEEGNTESARAVSTQRALFAARKASLAGAKELRDERILQVRQEIAAYKAQVVATGNQLALLEDEIKDAKWLLDKGLQRKPKYLSLQRQRENFQGEIRQKEALIARAEQEIAKTEQEKLQLSREREEQLSRETSEVSDAIIDARERLAIVEEQLGRVVVRAPVAGVVVGIATKTPGAVVAPGERLLEIVPSTASLIVEARIAPDDIASVTPGGPARVRLGAFNARQVTTIKAHTATVSADRMEDQRTGLPYYRAEIVLDRASVAAAGSITILPGMAADVYLETRSMTLLDYLLDPLIKSFERAARER